MRYFELAENVLTKRFLSEELTNTTNSSIRVNSVTRVTELVLQLGTTHGN